MFRCDYCHKVFKGYHPVCPDCGKKGTSWEPVNQQPPMPDFVRKITFHKLHYDD